jgi:YVTN family beta-propeller protein
LEIGLDGQIKRSVAVGKQPHEVQIDVKNGRAFVSNTTEPTISAIDIATFKHLDHLRSPYFGDAARGSLPHGMTQSRDLNTLYVTTERYEKPGIVAYDWKKGTARKYIETGQRGGHLIRFHPKLDRAYVMNRSSSSITVLDMTNESVLANIATPGSPIGFDLSPSGDLWVGTNDGAVYIIDTKTNTVRKKLMGKGTGNGRMYVSLDGKLGIATHADGADAFDAVKEEWTTYFPLENDQTQTGIKHAIYVCFVPNSDKMYISLINASTIVAYDMRTLKEVERWKLPARAYSLDLYAK